MGYVTACTWLLALLLANYDQYSSGSVSTTHRLVLSLNEFKGWAPSSPKGLCGSVQSSNAEVHSCPEPSDITVEHQI